MEQHLFKTPRESQMETRYIVMPQHANHIGIAFGGTIMSWVDMIAAMVAQKHCECEVVTASTDQILFRAPIQVGNHVVMKASVNYVGRTSMEVGVQVKKENPFVRESVHATTAYLTFVGIDDHGHPREVPKIRPETPEEVRRFEHARLRVQARLELLHRIRQSGHGQGI